MGFHKRRISKEGIVRSYKDNGIEGLKRLFTADALIVELGIDTDIIIEYLTNDDVTNLEKMVNEIESSMEVE